MCGGRAPPRRSGAGRRLNRWWGLRSGGCAASGRGAHGKGEQVSETAFDALLVAGFGGPESMAEVPEFLQRVSGGRIPPARLAEVGRHYARFGGVSPVNQQHRELAAELATRLRARAIDIPVTTGNRHTRPYFADVLAELAAAGRRRVLALVAAPYASYSGCRAYREELWAALPTDSSGVALIEVAKLVPYPGLPALVDAQVEVLRPALERWPGAHIVFTTHSIPVVMAETSGPGGGAYVAQQLALIARVMRRLAGEGVGAECRLAYQSRSGPPQQPWLEPDINDVLGELAAGGVEQVICSPIGFLTDHMEVVWDLDNEARATAERLGIGFTRVPTVGTSEVFLNGLTDLVAEALSGSGPSDGDLCGPGCCANPRGGEPPTVPGL